jgi:aryl-alcohol dehydrogenase-like predicted oxidoreductase
VHRIQLGDSETTISRMALGALQMGNATDEAESCRILDAYFDAGGSVVDTADMYEWYAFRGSPGGQSEGVIGRWMKGRSRESVFLSTKGGGMPVISPALWNDDGSANWAKAVESFPNASASNLRSSLEGSLRRLQTDYVDLYFVHVDDYNTPLEETLAILNAFIEEGKVRHIGWSNIMRDRLEQINGLCETNHWQHPVALQLQHSYLRPNEECGDLTVADPDRLAYLADHPSITLFAYSPILKGIYGNSAKRSEHPIMSNYDNPGNQVRLELVRDIAQTMKTSPNAVVLAWLMQSDRPAVVPLVGPRTLAQLDDLLSAARLELDPDTLARLNST